jgi:uncharacterized RDD family membrane protein YckC
MTTDLYVHEVLNRLPYGTPLREQIAAELRATIAERIAHGEPAEAVLRQLGDPGALAESYLSAVPLIAAPIWRRLVAKIVDIALLFFVVAPMLWVIARVVVSRLAVDNAPTAPQLLLIVSGLALIVTSILFSFYTAIAEYSFGVTVGKRLMTLQVVRETGARISFGQALVRQLAGFFQVAFVDAMFALFTEKNQRAFELLSKTRVVMSPPPRS